MKLCAGLRLFRGELMGVLPPADPGSDPPESRRPACWAACEAAFLAAAAVFFKAALLSSTFASFLLSSAICELSLLFISSAALADTVACLASALALCVCLTSF